MRRKIGIVVSAMIVASQLGTPLEAEEPTLDQLGQMAAMLEANDIEALRAFLLLNPELLEGDAALAVALRRFMVETRNLSDYLAFQPNLNDSIDLPSFEEGSSSY